MCVLKKNDLWWNSPRATLIVLPNCRITILNRVHWYIRQKSRERGRGRELGDIIIDSLHAMYSVLYMYVYLSYICCIFVFSGILWVFGHNTIHDTPCQGQASSADNAASCAKIIAYSFQIVIKSTVIIKLISFNWQTVQICNFSQVWLFECLKLENASVWGWICRNHLRRDESSIFE